jgi:hypothetical protein
VRLNDLSLRLLDAMDDLNNLNATNNMIHPVKSVSTRHFIALGFVQLHDGNDNGQIKQVYAV